MEFICSRPDVVRSINQRWLLNYWNRLRAGASLPKWQSLEAEELAASLESLSFQDVVGADDAARFQIRSHGKRIAELYGRTDCVGKFLDEILPPSYSGAAHSTYRQTVATKLPVYTIADMRDRSGCIVHYERLLLPFSDHGDVVSRILASLETVSPEGAFESRDLMQAPPKPPAFALCTTIQH
jgi:hypothetical protein